MAFRTNDLPPKVRAMMQAQERAARAQTDSGTAGPYSRRREKGEPMILLAIDPGSTQSAWVLYDTETKMPLCWGKEPNETVRIRMTSPYYSRQEIADNNGLIGHLAIEMVACYGMRAGRSLFDTCRWIGRFIEAWGGPYNLVLRKSKWGPGADDYMDNGTYPGVCMTMCKINTAKDTNIRQAIIDRYGGTKQAAIGLKATPGPLYGMKADQWAALAVALTWAEHMRECGLNIGANQ